MGDDIVRECVCADDRDASGAASLHSRSRPRRVLVCEDDPSIRGLVSILLGREQFEVVTATNGAEAISRLEDRFDVVILDLMMPSSNGYDVLNHLEVFNPALLERVIVMTARADVVRKSLGVQVAHTMVKPFDILELMATVHRLAGDS